MCTCPNITADPPTLLSLSLLLILYIHLLQSLLLRALIPHILAVQTHVVNNIYVGADHHRPTPQSDSHGLFPLGDHDATLPPSSASFSQLQNASSASQPQGPSRIISSDSFLKCDICFVLNRKCDGHTPCRNCQNRQLECKVTPDRVRPAQIPKVNDLKRLALDDDDNNDDDDDDGVDTTTTKTKTKVAGKPTLSTPAVTRRAAKKGLRSVDISQFFQSGDSNSADHVGASSGVKAPRNSPVANSTNDNDNNKDALQRRRAKGMASSADIQVQRGKVRSEEYNVVYDIGHNGYKSQCSLLANVLYS